MIALLATAFSQVQREVKNVLVFTECVTPDLLHNKAAHHRPNWHARGAAFYGSM